MGSKKLITVSAIICCFSLIICLFSSCSGSKKSETASKQTKTLEWAVSPSIEADGISPLVRADFNENTNHYDISYSDCFKIEKDGKFGIINLNGEMVLPAEYDDIFAIRNSKDYIAIKKTSSGKVQKYVHDGTFETESAYKTYNSVKYEYYWLVSASKALFVKNSGGDLSEQTLAATSPETVVGVAKSGKGYNNIGLYGLYFNGSKVNDQDYSGAGCFTDGIAAFKSNGMWGYVDSSGKTVIPFNFEAVKGYSAFGGTDTPYESYEGYVTLCKSSKFGIYTNNGTAVTDMVYDYATPVVSGKAYALTDGKWGVLAVNNDYQPSSTSENSAAKETETSTLSTTVTTEKSTTTSTSSVTSKTSDSDLGSYKINPDAGSVNLRSGSGAENEVVASLKGSTVVYVDKISNGWGHTVYNGQEGWFNLKYAEKQ